MRICFLRKMLIFCTFQGSQNILLVFLFDINWFEPDWNKNFNMFSLQFFDWNLNENNKFSKTWWLGCQSVLSATAGLNFLFAVCIILFDADNQEVVLIGDHQTKFSQNSFISQEVLSHIPFSKKVLIVTLFWGILFLDSGLVA